MTKNELIQLLQTIPGNPEVVIDDADFYCNVEENDIYYDSFLDKIVIVPTDHEDD